MNFLKLGWRWPRPNDFNGPDERPLKDSFQSLQRFMNWPYLGLRFDGNQGLTGTLTPVGFSPVSDSVSPFVAGDPYSLWAGAAGFNQILVPHDFDTWLVIGSACFETSGGAAGAILTTGWRINAVTADYLNHTTGSAASRSSVSFMAPVRKGNTLDVVIASSDATEDLIDAEAWLYFLPLA